MKKYLALLLITTQVLAADPTAIKKDTPAPYDGLLFSTEKANELRVKLIDLDLNVKLLDSVNKENVLLIDQLDRSNKRVENLSKEIVDSRDSGFFTHAGFFLLGGLAASLVAFGASRAVR